MNAKFLAGVGLSAALLFASSTTRALPYLFGDEVQLLEDDNAEILLDSAGNLIPINGGTTIQVGNLFAGVYEIQGTSNVPSGDNNIAVGNATPTFTSIFLLNVETTTDAAIDELTFSAATQAQWNAVFGAGGILDISSVFDVATFDGGFGLATGTTSLLFNGITAQNARFTGSSLSDSATTFVAGGTLQYSIGFTGAAGEFWNTIGENALLPALNGTTNPTIRFAQNITKTFAGPGLLAHNFLGSPAGGSDTFFTAPTQFQAKGNLPGGARGVWPVLSDTDVYLQAVPEPASLALLSAGLFGLGFASQRRRKGA